MRSNRLLFIILTLLLVGGGLVWLDSAPAQAQGQNLLTNPSFEAPYGPYVPETAQELADCPMGVCNTAQVAAGWKPWWVKERETDVNPEYKPADTAVAGNRVRSGQYAAQYFSFWTTHKAGLRQTVTVPAGATVEFSVWGFSWMSEGDDPFTSDYSGTPNMRVGIDPTGGTSPYGPAIVWSEYKQAFDSYQLFSVSAQAQGTQVTVFTFAAPSVNPNSPDYGFKHADMYWDDAALVVVGGAAQPAPTTAPADPGSQATQPAAPSAPVAGAPTATPNADGLILVEVQPGDSLWAIAARAGLTLEEPLQLNEMAEGAVINPGDMVIIGRVEAPTPTPEPTEEPAEATAAAATVAPTATPEPVEASICLVAFNDQNQDGVRDDDETLRDAVAFTITDGETVVSNYVTDGVSEPFCVTISEPGEYQITRSTVANELLTTPGDQSVTLAAGDEAELEFGSYVDEAAVARIAATNPDGPADGTVTPAEDASADAAEGGTLSGVAIAAVVVALIILVGVLLVILSARRTTA
jgi:hypothetical protein